MVLTLRSYIAVSVVLHAVALAIFSSGSAKVTKDLVPKSTVTIRSKPQVAKAPVALPKPVSKPVQKAAPVQKAVTKPKPVPKIIPVYKPDAQPAPEDFDVDAYNETADDDVGETTDVVVESGGGAASSGPVDLTREPSLVMGTLSKIEYTTEAKKARLQGIFPVDVHLDTEGNVIEVDLAQSVGFGMDERILEAFRSAKFNSKRDAAGKGIETWFTVQFKLEML